MMQLENDFNGQDALSRRDIVQHLSLVALSDSWASVFLVTYAVEFLCMCAAKLMVLDRMSVFAAPQGTRLQKRWATAGRVVMAVVVLGNAVGLAAHAAAAAFFSRCFDGACCRSACPALVLALCTTPSSPYRSMKEWCDFAPAAQDGLLFANLTRIGSLTPSKDIQQMLLL